MTRARPSAESNAARVQRHRYVLDSKPALQAVYQGWFARLRAALADLAPTVELGTGHGALREWVPSLVRTDVFRSPFADLVCDALFLPFANASVGNFALVDVVHHLEKPVRAFAEMARCLKPGGRIVVSEPYLSPLARAVFRFHHEPVDFSQPLGDASPPARRGRRDPFEGNMALGHKALVSETAAVLAEVPELRFVERTVSDWLVYPLSGGFGYPSLVPGPSVAVFRWIERRIPAMAWLAGFQVTATFERRP